MNTLRYGFLLLLGAAAATFIWSNYDQTVVVYFTKRIRTVETPLSVAIFVALIAGFLLATLQSLAGQFRLRARLRESKRTVEKLEKELTELRKLPLTEGLPPSPSSSEPDLPDEVLPKPGEL